MREVLGVRRRETCRLQVPFRCDTDIDNAGGNALAVPVKANETLTPISSRARLQLFCMRQTEGSR